MRFCMLKNETYFNRLDMHVGTGTLIVLNIGQVGNKTQQIIDVFWPSVSFDSDMLM